MKKFTAFLSILLTFTLILSSCRKASPPALEDVQNAFDKNREDIMTITNYFKDNDSYYMSVSFTDQELTIENNSINISNQSLMDAVKRLCDEDFIYAEKNYNNIIFVLWSPSYGVECGIVCAVDKTYNPTTAYTVEMLPLNEKGWFYFYDNYNEWGNKYEKNEEKSEDTSLL